LQRKYEVYCCARIDPEFSVIPLARELVVTSYSVRDDETNRHSNEKQVLLRRAMRKAMTSRASFADSVIRDASILAHYYFNVTRRWMLLMRDVTMIA